jgi:Uncharacterized protein conserved in bacteria, putative virulence factor
MKNLHAAIDWIATTRQNAPMLDSDADALLLRLHALLAQQQTLEQVKPLRSSIALYGHSQASKAWLLNALCGRGDGQLTVVAGEKRLDYFTHINPGHQPGQMAVRFTGLHAAEDHAWPLRLQLMRETELAQVFMTYAGQLGDCRVLDASEFAARLSTLQSLRQPHPTESVTSEEVAALVRFWQNSVPATQQNIDDTLWYRFVGLLPSLDLNARTHAWAMLWGEQQDLTAQWQTLVHGLHLLGHRREVQAPLSLLVDSFMLPTDGFLSTDLSSDQTVLVQTEPGHNVSIGAATLASLTLELVLNCENAVLDHVDLIDIPAERPTTDNLFQASKSRWLLEGFRQRLQPDLLLVCHATAQRNAISDSAKSLTCWAKETQPRQESSLPGLVWAITPQDDRLARKSQHDEAVQQLVAKSGERWGTLHAFDHSSLQRLIEWLSQATSATVRSQRLEALNTQYRQQLNHLFAPLLAPAAWQPTQVESLIRELQSQAARHGELLEGLLPPLQRFDILGQARQTREARVSGLFHTEVDLFSEPENAPERPDSHQDIGTQAWLLWCQHLRQWSRQEVHARNLSLSHGTLQQLAGLLIITAHRLGLPVQLRAAATQQHAGAAQLRAIIGNFIAWLGYADLPETERPASRVAKGCAIFSQPAGARTRLTQLGDQPVHAATRYVYDWLVALYTRASERENHREFDDISPSQRQTLRTLFGEV